MRSVCDCMQCKGNSSVLRALYILGHKFGEIRGPFAYVWCDAGEGVGGYYIRPANSKKLTVTGGFIF